VSTVKSETGEPPHLAAPVLDPPNWRRGRYSGLGKGLLGRRDLRTTMNDTHVLPSGAHGLRDVRSGPRTWCRR
jgi:hypothetical protein